MCSERSDLGIVQKPAVQQVCQLAFAHVARTLDSARDSDEHEEGGGCVGWVGELCVCVCLQGGGEGGRGSVQKARRLDGVITRGVQ